MLMRFYKPFGVLCQFRDPTRPTLANYIDVPGVYPAGRLDLNSEGLLLLTDNGALQARLSHPRHKVEKVYWAQVEGHPDPAALARLCTGVALADGVATARWAEPCTPVDLPPRAPAVTPHRAANASWVELALTEGRNRQVRRMLATVGHPVLRLVRVRIGPWSIAGLQPGESERLPPEAEAWAFGQA